MKSFMNKPSMKKYRNEKIEYLVNSKRETQEQIREDLKTNPENRKLLKN
ncbi:MAG: hypothetical protein ACJAZY_002216 [Spirosomataceae bacterium]|jgi:hypothetical protein